MISRTRNAFYLPNLVHSKAHEISFQVFIYMGVLQSLDESPLACNTRAKKSSLINDTFTEIELDNSVNLVT